MTKKISIGLITVLLLGPMFAFTNCGENEFSQGDETTQSQLSNEADFLLWLDRYRKRAAELREVDTAESNTLAEELETNLKRIDDMIDPSGQNLPHHHSVVLGVRDYLDASYADGGDLILRLDFNDEIAKLNEKDLELEGKISQLESRLNTELQNVKEELEGKIAAGDAENLSYIQTQLSTVSAQIEALKQADNETMVLITGLRNDVDENKKQIESNRELIANVEKNLIKAISDNNTDLVAQLNNQKSELMIEINTLTVANNSLQNNLTTLTNQHRELANNFITFKSEVNARFDNIEKRISSLESRLSTIDDTVSVLDSRISEVNDTVANLQDSTAASLQNLKQSILDVRADTESQILALKRMNLELKDQIADQELAFQSLLESQRNVGDLQEKMCKANDQRTTCTGNEDSLTADCCIALSNLNCEAMFSDPTQLDAKNQCNIILMTLKNHDEQLRAIKEVDENQNTMISGLLDDIKNLSQSVDQITSSLEEVTKAVESAQESLTILSNAMSKLDQRLLLEEFKSARAEAVAAINERNDHYLAWITRRYTDVRNKFCISNANTAYDKSDYEAARQNHSYCVEKLEQLTQAKELVHVAKSYANGLASVNVDVTCDANIDLGAAAGGARPASELTIDQTRFPKVFSQIFDQCKTTGGQVLARALLMQVVALQNLIGPDFRNIEYMRSKSKIVQLIYLHALAKDISGEEVRIFEDHNPTSFKNHETFYGQVERVFVNNYVDNRLRDSQGNYIYDLAKIPGKISGLDKVYTHAQIANGTSAYFNRMKELEINGRCFDCGYKVEGRNLISRNGKKFFSYPKDPVSQCPVHEDHIIAKGNDGKYYSYRLHYSRRSGATEHMTAYYHNHQSGHLPIANSEQDANDGKFGYCANVLNNQIVHRFGMPNTHLRGRLVYTFWKPYSRTHGKPQCRRYYFSCVPMAGEWKYTQGVSPTSNVMHYLSGLPTTTVQNHCSTSGAGYTTKTRQLSTDEKAHLRTYVGTDRFSANNTIETNTNTASQLTSTYWFYREAPVSYGKDDQPFSAVKPIIGNHFAESSKFFRTVFAPTNNSIDVDQCYDPGSEI